MGFLENLKKSKGFRRGVIIFFAAVLTFGGPTYMMYILNEAGLSRLLILAAGLVFLILGLVLFTYIIKEEKLSN